jgi:hypothetical protein
MVRCGTLTLADPNVSYMDYKIEEFITHPSYNKSFYDDIALIRVEGIIQ